MKALFEVTTIEADWKPPFKKNIATQEYFVGPNEGFDRIMGNGNDEAVFILTQVSGDRAKVNYSKLFTPKAIGENYGKDKSFWAIRGKEEVLSYLWGEKGITKKIVYKGISQAEMEEAEPPEEENEEPQPEEPKESETEIYRPKSQVAETINEEEEEEPEEEDEEEEEEPEEEEEKTEEQEEEKTPQQNLFE